MIIKIPFLVILFIIPFLIYIIDNFIQTGSPIFPYYNNIFKSEYFGNFSWKESRFGTPSIKHALVWPIYVSCIIQGYGDDWLISDYIWGIGFVISILMFIYLIINKDKNNYKIFCLTIISLILTAGWIMFLEGYMRYALSKKIW